ncbi:WecB/TagA/CpsF family glycosyltransferase [Natronoglycomyces albus]|uniref:WecB/TagA/CpsF family glycosyltransferase n=1 Tax=Natronoglycomyces albus TaxID=2811108 RepID=A0A895XKY5_9ACTN|nr:WecB/TagA/CpsF family glycosyltransferase [Natronoglycomyces albus]QSB04223.1 WecB/TagA/CpsF family glycosyltransferase [Natronoglycomyces albus]
MSQPRLTRVDVLGVEVSTVNQDMALEEISRWVDHDERHYVCVTGVHGVMECQRDESLRAIHNDSGLTTPDGMPMVWAGHKAGADWMDRVYGPDLMLNVLQRAADKGWTSFLYGGKDGVPELLAQKLTARIPNLKIVGTYSPPFRPLTPEEDAQIVQRINDSGADFVWVGLSTPKQEKWMAAHRDKLNAAALFGVGAAFDFHAGLVPQAPEWMQKRGLEWFFRLTKEPKRLWRRYFRNNPAYLWNIRRRPPKLVDSA